MNLPPEPAPAWLAQAAHPVRLFTRWTVIRNLADRPFSPTDEAARLKLAATLAPLPGLLTGDWREEASGGELPLWAARNWLPGTPPPTASALRRTGGEERLLLGDHDHAVLILPSSDDAEADYPTEAADFDTAFRRLGPPAELPDIGLLTSSPRRAGLGLGLEQVLHLPALTITRQLPRVLAAAAQFGWWGTPLTPRGGALVALSNLGARHPDPAALLISAELTAAMVIETEEAARSALLAERGRWLADRLGRCRGLAREARLVTSAEAAAVCSWLRLGSLLGLCDTPVTGTLDALRRLQPRLVQYAADRTGLAPAEVRAAVISEL